MFEKARIDYKMRSFDYTLYSRAKRADEAGNKDRKLDRAEYRTMPYYVRQKYDEFVKYVRSIPDALEC